jgi:LmbE family N-acetylglucosaminyl deacetylase
MLPLILSRPEAPLRVLCLGAHADDIEIGCGGFILSLIAGHRAVEVHWVVFSAPEPRATEARLGASLFLEGAQKTHLSLEQFQDGFFPSEAVRIKERFEELKRETMPDVVLTHYRDDRHQDHRVLSDLAWNTFRDHWILEYEIPKFDGDLGSPNVFVPLARPMCERKVAHLDRAFGSQRDKHWFSDETFLGLMRLRGMECRAPGGFAEAFYVRKTVIGFQ